MANYPWDGTADRGTHYSRAPDDAAFLHLAHVYADAHATMHASPEFKGGVTNGAHWYPLWGGMQVGPLFSPAGMSLRVRVCEFPNAQTEKKPSLLLACLSVIC